MDAIVTLRHASDLGTWTFHETRPRALADTVETIWEVQGTVAHSRSRIFPNRRVELLVNLGPPQRVEHGLGLERFDTTCVSGVQTGPVMVEASEGTHLFGVRLRAEAAGALLGVSMDTLSGRLAVLPDVLGRAGRALVERIVAAPSFAIRARTVCRWIEETALRRAPAAHVAWIASEIESSGGAASIASLRASSRVSARRLAADFREQVGVTPKVLARLVRFQRAMGLLRAPCPSITDVALEAGYYDQSHLGLDFRELAGISPREFVATVYPDGTSAVA